MERLETTVLANFRKVSFVERALWYINSTRHPESAWSSNIAHMSGSSNITPNTITTFHYTKYRIIIMIDLPPSVFSYNSKHNDFTINLIPSVVKKFLEFLYENSADINAKIDLGIICVRMPNEPIKVVVQSYRLQHFEDSIDIVDQLSFYLHGIQSEIGNTISSLYSNERLEGGIEFTTSLKWSLFALNLMDDDALPMVVYITDAVNCNLVLGIYDGLVMQYCRADVAFHIINLSDGTGSYSSQFGYLPDPMNIKLMAKATGGIYMTPSNMHEKTKLILERKIFLTAKRDTYYDGNENLQCSQFEEYCVPMPHIILVQCTLREGFMLKNIDGEKIILWFNCHCSTKIEYIIYPIDNDKSTIQINIIGRPKLFKKLKMKGLTSPLLSKESKPSLAARVIWLIQNMKETEQTALNLYQGITRNDIRYLGDKMVNIHLSKWHRWFHVESLDLIIVKLNQNQPNYGREKVRDKIKTLGSGCFMDDMYIEIVEKTGIFAAKINWEIYNKAAIYFAFFECSTEFRLEKLESIYSSLKKSCQEVFERPMCKAIVEEAPAQKKSYWSKVYSVFTYRPHSKAIKSFMFKCIRRQHLYTMRSAQLMINILFASRLKQGFYSIGYCERDKYLLLKPLEVEIDNRSQSFFIQYLIYIEKTEVVTELYVEPALASFYDKFEYDLLQEIKEEYETYDDFMYSSIFCLDFLIYKCLEHKLDNGSLDDTMSSDDYDTKVIEISEDDDLFCYIQVEDLSKAENYDEIKAQTYEKMYEVMNSFQNFCNCIPKLPYLLKHSNYYSLDLEVFSSEHIYASESYRSALGRLYSNTLTAFIDMSDYQDCLDSVHHFVRYINSNTILIWLLPSFEEFLYALSCSKKSFPIYLYECSQHKLDTMNIDKRRQSAPIVLLQQNTTLCRSIQLLQRIYKAVLNGTYYQALKNEELLATFEDMERLVSCCEISTYTIEISIIYNHLHKQWDSLEDLSKCLISRSLELNSDLFREIDEKFNKLLSKYFKRIPNSNYFILNDDKEKCLLSIDDFTTLLSHCTVNPEVSINLYSLQHKTFFSKERHQHKNLESPISPTKKIKTGLLSIVGEKARSLYAEITLDLLSKNLPIDPITLSFVLEQLNYVHETVKFEYKVESVLKEQDITELINQEFVKGKVVSTRTIGNVHFVVCQIVIAHPGICQEMVDNDYSVPFWVIINVLQPNIIECSFFLPDHMKNTELTVEKVQARLTGYFKDIEIRVNQRMLLKQLEETGKISNLLMNIDNQIEFPNENYEKGPRERAKKRFTRFSTTNKILPNQKPITKNLTAYKLPLQHTNQFIVSDRLAKNESINSLVSKFSIPPFLIDNREGLYQLAHDSDILVFKFSEIEQERIASYPKHQTTPNNSPSHRRTSSSLIIRMVKLEIYGIDPPSADTIEKLEQRVQEQLQQISLFKLADSLIKNQKNVMTLGDSQFIQGNLPPIIILFPITSLVSDINLLAKYTKQNLMRFLVLFQIRELLNEKEPSVLVYNYLNIIESSSYKTNSPIFKSRQETKQAQFLGNTFGKALALLYLDVYYFNGENIIPFTEVTNECSPTFETWNENYIKAEMLINKTSGMSSPSFPGNYLEIKIYKNGPLNESIFFEKLNKCINQSISEYLIENLIQSCIKEEKYGYNGYKQIADLTKRAIELSLHFPTQKIEHYAPPFALFQFFSKILHIFQENNKQKFPLVMCLEEGEIKHISSSIENLQSLWELEYLNEKSVGKKFKFSAMGGPSSLGNLIGEQFEEFKCDDMKFYSDEIGEGLGQIPRSFFIYIEITNTFLDVYTYNWNKTTLQKLHSQIESHVHWNRQRYRLVNNALTQKLGLFHHNIPMDTFSFLRKTHQIQMFPQACVILELKEEFEKFSLDSLLNSDEITHTAITTEDSVQTFKMTGMFPMLKDIKNTEEIPNDKVKLHGYFLNMMYEKKRAIYEDCYKLAYAFKKWVYEKDSSAMSIVNQLLKKGGSFRNESNLARELITQAQMIHCEKARLFFEVLDVPATELDRERQKMQKLIANVMRYLVIEIKRTTKLDDMKEDYGFMRKSSHDFSPENSSSNLLRRKRTSSGMFDTESNIQVFLKKALEQAIIILEVSYDKNFIITSSYCVESIQKLIPFTSRDDDPPSMHLKRELQKIKTSIQSETYIYDAHIKHLCYYLCRPRDYPSINLIATLNTIGKLYYSKPPSANNWQHTGMMSIDLGELNGITIKEIYHYFTLNCDEYGFTAFTAGSTPWPVYKVFNLSGEELAINQENGSNNASILELSPSSSVRRISNFSSDGAIPTPPPELKYATSLRAIIYTLIDTNDSSRPRPVLRLEDSETIYKLRIRYYILNFEKTKKGGPKDTLKQIKTKAEEFILEAIKKSKSHFRRDQLWERLGYLPSKDICPYEDFLQLLQASDVQPIEEIDPRISLLTSLGNVFTSDCFDYLYDVFKEDSRRFEDKDCLHLVIFNSPRLCAHLKIISDEQNLKINAVRRSKEYNKDVEDNFISDIVSEILQWLWSRVTSR
ncbi:unnamed protein product [Blepharisma stoltei]|uniref:VWFA domain-containing protein n=1 Tax=Blepharisma stoltei TaxID=1481888 RepID=A0AAU9JLK9_9CILI|nr:unnamed protein product [Blepharisma stoltei]